MERLDLFFTYFGGKWRIAQHYPMPVYDTIIEPFAGSAGYSLHYPHKKVLLYDLDPIICGVWDFLIRSSEADILALPSKVVDARDLPVCQEAKWLIGFWLNKGMTAPCNIPGKWMRDHLRQGQRINSYWGDGIKRRIASQLCRIRHWKIKNTSYVSIPNRDACWYIDPPYTDRASRYRYSKVDYPALAEWCRERRGQVIVCEQEGATWLPFAPFRAAKTMEGCKGSKSIKEVLWTNDRVKMPVLEGK